ncbi:SDR family NAD(P)-dependent oxidoreductase, partial [Streptomyces sp. NPDC059766]|uniref:SDR family NAD(P)-dependent oxidoreductase n=1 Tax=Streptomyces sp. NPDC059766 TaxID=3346940 RepID=UPI0036593B4F
MTSSSALTGRAAVVTGATRGIGRAVARELAAAGARLCVTGRDADAVRRTAAELGGIGLAGSVADPAHPRELTELVLREYGRIDVVVNNAATNQPYGPLMGVAPEAWRAAFAVNVEAPLRLVQCAWHAWLREHGGAVVNICTEGAEHVGPNVGAYGTSKAALLHLTRRQGGGEGGRGGPVAPPPRSPGA